MHIDFYEDVQDENEDPIAVRQWPMPPREREVVTFSDVKNEEDGSRPAFRVVEVFWGDTVMGNGDPIKDQPCAVVVVNRTDK